MFKHKIKNYFFFEIIKHYIFVLSSLTLLLIVLQASRLLPWITENGMSVSGYFEYLIYSIPRTISQLMIISILISLFINFIKFEKNKELEIYWQMGFSKMDISLLVLKISLFITFIALIIYSYIAPSSNLVSRNIIAKSDFNIINSIIKKNNFNSPLTDVTIYVRKNDNKGNLEKIYIFEKNKTIISQKGRVINVNEKTYLELFNGTIHQKNEEKINTIKFEKTTYDFTKFKTTITTTPKIQEQNIKWILDEYKKSKNPNLLYEINKRFIKPLFIPLIAIICCFALYSNFEKKNPNAIKISTFSFATFILILIEIFLNFSSNSVLLSYLLFFFPFLTSVVLFFILNYFFKSENKIK